MIATILFTWIGFGIVGVIFHALYDYHITYISYGDLVTYLIGILFGPIYALLALTALISESKWWHKLNNKWAVLRYQVIISKKKCDGTD